MAPLLCRQRQSGMLGFCCCFQHLLHLTLDPSPSNAHSCRHWKHTMILRTVIISIISLILVSVICITRIILIKTSGWLESVGSRVLYELDYKKLILYVIPIESILGKLPVVPVGNTRTIPHRLRTHFPGAPGDRRPGSGDGCRMWFVNSRALGWSREVVLLYQLFQLE